MKKGEQRLRVVIKGAVQGVGFRPFVFKLASSLDLKGWVINSSQGVFIEVEGGREVLKQFLIRLDTDKPGHAFIQSLESSYLDPEGFSRFEIRTSQDAGEKTVVVLPDIATCPECLAEVFDPANRRYLYPFTNCTLCGPRYSIIETLPYDRPATSMKGFVMCADCQAEYEDPNDRRFHAQPNACPVCGPRVYAVDRSGNEISSHLAAIDEVVGALQSGRIIAVKGLGGFHLMVDARNNEAVKELRRRKRRNEKPFAIMAPSLETVEDYCVVSDLEKRLLFSSESPILLLQRKSGQTSEQLAEEIAPGNPTLGMMLPYTPLHHILLWKINAPVVATSGNISDEPICIEESEALQRLGRLADLFLFHNRPILRHVDDSVVRVMADRELVIRRARGYAPLPIAVKTTGEPVLAVGAHQKNTVALLVGENVVMSQHLGDLETEQTLNAFEQCIDSLKTLFDIAPRRVYCDQHPDYLSSAYARETGIPLDKVQHHRAHVASCMAENQLTGSVLGVAWDGTGAGDDGTIWGGEFLKGGAAGLKRIAWLRTFPLPGSTQAVKEPRRSAMGLLFEIFREQITDLSDLPTLQAFTEDEMRVMLQMLQKGINSPLTSSAGRLFDAVASLVGIRHMATFEGQGAMELEFALSGLHTDEYYSFGSSEILDWGPMIKEVIYDWRQGTAAGIISAKFHNTLVEMIIAVARRAGERQVVVSGGCFQNRYLTERTIERLSSEGFSPYWHQRVPPNDGGIALGQIYSHLNTDLKKHQ